MSDQKISAVGDTTHTAPAHEEAAPPAYCCTPLLSTIASCCSDSSASIGDMISSAYNNVLYFFTWLMGNTDIQIGERFLDAWSMRAIPTKRTSDEYTQARQEWRSAIEALPEVAYRYVQDQFADEQRNKIAWPKVRSGEDESWTDGELAACRDAICRIPGDQDVLRYVRKWSDREKCRGLDEMQVAAWFYQTWNGRQIPADVAQNYPLVQAEWVDHLTRFLSDGASKTVWSAFVTKHHDQIGWPLLRSRAGESYNAEEVRAIEHAIKDFPGDQDCLEAVRIWMTITPIKVADSQATNGLDAEARADWFCQKWQGRVVPAPDDPSYPVLVAEWMNSIVSILSQAYEEKGMVAFATHYRSLIKSPSGDARSLSAHYTDAQEAAIRQVLKTKPVDPIFIKAVRDLRELVRMQAQDKAATEALPPAQKVQWFYDKWKGRDPKMQNKEEWMMNIVEILPEAARRHATEVFVRPYHGLPSDSEMRQREVDKLLKAQVCDASFLEALSAWVASQSD